jgi:hypothetical protein
MGEYEDLKSAGGEFVRVRPPLAPQIWLKMGKQAKNPIYRDIQHTRRSVPYVF